MLRQRDLNLISSPRLSPIGKKTKVTKLYSPSPLKVTRIHDTPIVTGQQDCGRLRNSISGSVSGSISGNISGSISPNASNPTPTTTTTVTATKKSSDPWGIVNAFKNQKQQKPVISRKQEEKISLNSKSSLSDSVESLDSWEVYIPGTVSEEYAVKNVGKKDKKVKRNQPKKPVDKEEIPKRTRLMRSAKK